MVVHSGRPGESTLNLPAGDLDRSAAKLLARVLDMVPAFSILAVGSEQPAWLRAAQSIGISDLGGIALPGSPAEGGVETAGGFCSEHGEFSLARKFDLVVFSGLLDRLTSGDHSTFLKSLVNHGDVILFIAPSPHECPPEKGGAWPEYWAKLFGKCDYFCCDVLRQMIWSDLGIVWNFRQNAILYVKKEVWFSNSRLSHLSLTPSPLAMVHPDSLAADNGLSQGASEVSPDLSRLQRLAELALSSGDNKRVVDLCSIAIGCGEATPTIRHLMGLACLALGDNFVATENLGKALASVPGHLALRLDFARALLAVGMAGDAVAILREGEKSHPDDMDLGIALFSALVAEGREAEAQATLERLHRHHPDHVACLAGLAAWYADHGEIRRGVELMQRAAALSPGTATMRSHIASMQMQLGETREAVRWLEQAVELEPADGALHLGLADALLEDSRSERAFRELEWRREMTGVRPPVAEISQWRGESLAGARILVTAEYGPAEMIQFSRFLPSLRKCGAREIFVECHSGLERLLSEIDGVSACISAGSKLPSVEFAIPLLSLPAALVDQGISLDVEDVYLSLPKGTYFPIPAERIQKVGLAWMGEASAALCAGTMSAEDRTCPLQDLVTLPYLSGWRFYSLQVGPSAESLRESISGIIDLSPVIPDFTTLAAAIARMDLVVTVNNHVAHLAAAMGKPVWLLLHPKDRDYRWRPSEHPWYSSARIFRGAWSTSVLEVMDRLKLLSDGGDTPQRV